MNEQLPIDESEWYKCNYCNKEFLSKERLEDHRQVVHLGEGSGCVNWILNFLLKVFAVLFIIGLVYLGVVTDVEYHKQITKEAIQELNNSTK